MVLYSCDCEFSQVMFMDVGYGRGLLACSGLGLYQSCGAASLCSLTVLLILISLEIHYLAVG